MSANSRIGPTETQQPLFCLQCIKLLILIPGHVIEVDDHTGVFLGYLHKNCAEEWKLMNPTCTVEPVAA
jgi:hypothetical protein